ncbi:MAG: formate dehydrogenase subunit gamma [Pararhodobacter sp.]
MPSTPAFGDSGVQTLREILDAHRGMEGALLPILHGVQAAFGHVPPEALPIIAQDLNISRAEAHGVMSFYHDFREVPAGRTVLKLCRAESCQAVGADALADHARDRLGVDWHGTTADGAVTLEPVFCLGLCACGPAAMVNGKLVGRADAARIDRILEGAR